jgi:rhamnosyltransferase
LATAFDANSWFRPTAERLIRQKHRYWPESSAADDNEVQNSSGSEVNVAHSVCAIIVTYNPSPDVLRNIAILRPQVSSVLVIDNGSSEHHLAMLRGGRFECGFELIENGANLGIGAALNIGIREARARGYSWVALFDQDSRVEDGFIDSMLTAFEKAPNPSQVGIVCPIYVDTSTGVAFPIQRSKSGEILSAMTSGSLIPIQRFDLIGTFNERLFIDYVDIEYCVRSRRAGYRILQSPRAILHHSLGRITRHRLLGRWFASTNHSVARRYYIARNRSWVLWQFKGDWTWSSSEFHSAIRDTIKVLLVEKDRLAKMKNMMLGFIDALRGRMGKRLDL